MSDQLFSLALLVFGLALSACSGDHPAAAIAGVYTVTVTAVISGDPTFCDAFVGAQHDIDLDKGYPGCARTVSHQGEITQYAYECTDLTTILLLQRDADGEVFGELHRIPADGEECVFEVELEPTH